MKIRPCSGDGMPDHKIASTCIIIGRSDTRVGRMHEAVGSTHPGRGRIDRPLGCTGKPIGSNHAIRGRAGSGHDRVDVEDGTLSRRMDGVAGPVGSRGKPVGDVGAGRNPSVPGAADVEFRVLLAPVTRQIGGVPDQPEDPAADRSPVLGRFVAISLAALFVMVAFGVFWIWRHARGEQDWRDRINAAEPFAAPTNRTVHP